MHGGTSPGAPTGKANGNYRSGVWTKEWLRLRREVTELRRRTRDLIGEGNGDSVPRPFALVTASGIGGRRVLPAS